MNEKAQALAETAKPAMKHGANRFTMEQEDRVDNYKLYNTKGETRAEYLTSVIARDHPEIHEDMKAARMVGHVWLTG